MENDSWVMYSLGAVETFNEDLTLITQHFEQTKQFAFIQHFYDWDSFEMDLKADELSTPFYDAWINKVNHSYLSMN